MKKLLASLALWLFYVPMVHAQDFGQGNLKSVGDTAKITTTQTLPVLIGNLVRTFIGLLGIIFLLLVVYAGVLWLTAQGDDEKVTHAKDLLKNAVIGLIIITVAYALTGFIINAVLATTKATGT